MASGPPVCFSTSVAPRHRPWSHGAHARRAVRHRYVDFVTAACLADHGHDITGIDVDGNKVEMINRSQSPIITLDWLDLEHQDTEPLTKIAPFVVTGATRQTCLGIYGERSDGLTPVRAHLSPSLQIVGFMRSGDDMDNSLWRSLTGIATNKFCLKTAPAFSRICRYQYSRSRRRVPPFFG
jgi:hypothetical protein